MSLTSCEVEDCHRPPRSRSARYCGLHYVRIRRHGDPMGGNRVIRPPGLTLRQSIEYFPTVTTPSGCQLWSTGVTHAGYPQMRWNGTMILVHRAVYELHIGPIPQGMEIDHECRVPRCINPQHLRPATRAQNNQNKVARRDSITGIRGVQLLANGRYRARVKVHGKRVIDKVFNTLEEANTVAIEARNRVFTHNATDRKGV